ncbi:acyltransferase family protein [Collinsella aerofaciens]|nr:acyltransferase [Collinsella aerofaciens]
MVRTTHALENSLMGSKASRNTSIEALRLVAVAGIAMFHTFQWTFQAVCTGLPEYAPLAAFPYSGVLGFINLLGCWANEVFFMISGYFLVPSAVRALQNGSSAQDLTLKSLRRLKKIVLPTLFYCAACLFVSIYVYPLPEISLHESVGSRWASSLSGSTPPQSAWRRCLG